MIVYIVIIVLALFVYLYYPVHNEGFTDMTKELTGYLSGILSMRTYDYIISICNDNNNPAVCMADQKEYYTIVNIESIYAYLKYRNGFKQGVTQDRFITEVAKIYSRALRKMIGIVNKDRKKLDKENFIPDFKKEISFELYKYLNQIQSNI